MKAVFNNSISKKVAMTMMVAVMTIVGVLSVDGEKAFAYTDHCIDEGFYVYSDQGGLEHSMCTRDDASNVYVSIRQFSTPGVTINWKMELQRYTNGAWSTIGTRTGYVSYSSPSSRTFTGVAQSRSNMRVKATFYGTSTKVVYSKYWTR